MRLLRKVFAGFLFLVIAVPAAWTALLKDDSSPITLLAVSLVSGLIAAVLWRDKLARPKHSSNDTAVVQATTAASNEGYVPAGYAESGVDERLAAYYPDDCLGRAAEIGKATREAEKSGDHDLVWRLVHMQKMEYLRHAAKSGFTHSQTLALDGRLHKVMANVLRKEGKHRDALVHILYWASSYDKISRTNRKIVQAYINRANLPGARDSEVFDFLRHGLQRRDLADTQSQVAKWSSAG